MRREKESSCSLGLATAGRLIRIKPLFLRASSNLRKLGEALKTDEDGGINVGTVSIDNKNTRQNKILDDHLDPALSANFP